MQPNAPLGQPVQPNPMPLTVKAAIVLAPLAWLAQSGLLDADGIDPESALYSFATLGVVLYGLVTAHRLAWQWGRLLGGLSAIGAALFALVIASESVTTSIFLWLAALALVTFVVLLSMPASKRFFRLYCPRCGSYSSKSADFFFSESQCSCGANW